MSDLILHVDSQPVNRAELATLHTPEPTDTWHPVGHGDFLDLVVAAVENANVDVTDVKIGLSDVQHRKEVWGDRNIDFGTSRHRMFGVVETSAQIMGGQGSCTIGFRNSTDQTFAAGVCLGARVFVCDNRVFTADRIIQRKHTSGILRDLPGLLETAVVEMVDGIEGQRNMWDAFAETDVDDVLAESIMVRAADAGVIPWAKIPKVREQWLDTPHEEFKGRNGWSLFNGFTEILKQYPTDSMAQRSMELTGLFRGTFGYRPGQVAATN